MKTRYLTLILSVIAAVVGLCALCQDAEEKLPNYQTFVYVGTNANGSRVRMPSMNGRFWRGLDLEAKAALVCGYGDGLALLVREIYVKSELDVARKTQEISASLLDARFSYSDFISQIDEVYSDTANIRVPGIDAYTYSLLKFRGASQKELEDHVVALRRKYNN